VNDALNPDIQFNPLAYPVYVMTKAGGAACNLNCAYCYYLGKEALLPHAAVMSEEMLELFIRQYIQAQPSDNVLFTWHGGEPLLQGVAYYQKALQLQNRYGRGKRIDNSLQTNGVLLTDEWCRFFRDNNFLIGLSLDGPEHCHDRYRADKGGRGTFTRVMRGLDLLRKHGVEFNILSVVNDYNARYPLDVYHFFKQEGIRFIQFSPVVERLDDAGNPVGVTTGTPDLASWSVPAEAYGDFLCTIFDEWLRGDVGTTFVTMFDATLAGYAGVSPGVCVFAPVCGHAAAIEANGDLYSCDHFVFPEYKLGNIHHKTITQMMLSDTQLSFGNAKSAHLPECCLACNYLPLCNGECPKNRIIELKGDYPLNYLCAGLKKYFRHTEPYMRYMAGELAAGRPPATVMEMVKTGRLP
jgi:uncharacterized protein